MLQSLRNIWDIPDLRKRVLFTLGMLAIYRLGSHVPTPGINAAALIDFFEQNRANWFGLVDMFSGGNLAKVTVFALGIMPYISASIILQLLTVVWPYLEKLSKEGEVGRKKITQYTRYGTVVLSVIQSLGISGGPGILFKPIRLFSDSTRILVAAMEAKLINRLICVTGLGAGESRGKGNLLYNAVIGLILVRAYDDKTLQERIIRNSTLDWVIARPGVLTNKARTGRYKVLTDPRDWRTGFISRANVADFLVKQIEGDAYLRQAPVLIG